jgi:hypothetical protein
VYSSIGEVLAVQTRLTWRSYSSSIRLTKRRAASVQAVEGGNAAQQHRVELVRDLDVIRGPARAFAQRGEIEPGDALAAATHRILRPSISMLPGLAGWPPLSSFQRVASQSSLSAASGARYTGERVSARMR